MSDFQKLISLRESISSRIELSSEEQDRIYLKISLDLLEWWFIDESIETLDNMTSWWRDEWLRNIIDGFIIKHEYWYALNAVTRLKSSQEKDEFYIKIIKKKIISGEKDKLIMFESLILNPNMKEEAMSYINDPDIIIESESKRINEIQNIIWIEKSKDYFVSSIHKAENWDIEESIRLLEQVSIIDSEEFINNITKLFYIAIRNSNNLKDLAKIKKSFFSTNYIPVNEFENINSELYLQSKKIYKKNKVEYVALELKNVLHILLIRDEIMDYNSFLNDSEREIYIVLVKLLENCPLIRIEKKRIHMPYICFIGWENFVYSIKSETKKLRSKSVDIYRNELRKYLLKNYLKTI